MYDQSGQIKLFKELWVKIPKNRSPFVHTGRSLFFNKMLSEGAKGKVVRKVHQNTVYVLFNDFASANSDGKSIGYYAKGSLIKYIKRKDDTLTAELTGENFFVISETGKSSVWGRSFETKVGELDISKMPAVLELAYVLDHLKIFLNIKNI